MTTWCRAASFCARAPTPAPTLKAIHKKVQEINDHILPPGVKMVSFLDRSDLVQYTTHTVLRNLAEGFILVSIVLFLFLGNARSALIVALTIPFALLFASIFLDLRHIPANLLSLGALDFGMVVDGAVVMVENILRQLSRRDNVAQSIPRANSRRRARSAKAGVLRHHDHHYGLFAHLHAAKSGRPDFPADGLDGGVRTARSADIFDAGGAGSSHSFVSTGKSASGKIRCWR